MAYLGILPEAPSFSTQLARGLGGGIGEGLSQAAKFTQQMMRSNQKDLRKQKLDRERIASTAYQKLPKLLKDKYNAESIDKIVPIFSNLMRDSNLSEDEAFALAQHIFNSPKEEGGFGGGETKKRDGMGLAERFAEALSPKAERFQDETPEHREKRLQRGVNLTSEERAQKEYPYGLASFLRKEPGKNLAAAGIGALSPIEAASSMLGSTLPPEWFGLEKGSTKTPLSDWLRKKAGITELTPKGQELASSTEALGSLLPIEGAIGALSGARPGASALKSYAPPQIEGALPKELPFLQGEKAAEKVSTSLAERVSKEVPQSATEMRVGRLSPKERLFESKKQQQIIHSQLKQYPKYAEEIAADEADRAARYNRVLGPKALETKAQKMEYYSRQMPDVRKGYENSIARIRALEDQLAAQPELGSQIQPLIKAAQQSLKENEFLLRQTLNNAKTGESRVGFDDMKKSAQDKVLDIEAKVAEGEEFPLTKKDYNPEFIRQAKSLQNKKPIPSSRTEDYFTQVHDGYGQVYKNRLNDLNQKIEQLAQTRTLGSLFNRQKLNKEREVLKKLIDHVEAENTLHRHKIALREMQQRKLAQERLSKLRPSEGEPKVSKVAGEKMWKDRISEAKTPQEKVKVIEEAAEDLAAKDPKNAEKIRAESKKAEEFVKEQPAYPKSDDFIHKSDKEAANAVKKRFQRLVKDWEDLKKSMPYFWRSKMGMDFLIGVGSAIAADAAKEMGFDLPAELTALLVGRQVQGVRRLTHYATRKFIQKLHLERAKQAYRSNDMAKFNQFSKSVKAEAKSSFKK